MNKYRVLPLVMLASLIGSGCVSPPSSGPSLADQTTKPAGFRVIERREHLRAMPPDVSIVALRGIRDADLAEQAVNTNVLGVEASDNPGLTGSGLAQICNLFPNLTDLSLNLAAGMESVKATFSANDLGNLCKLNKLKRLSLVNRCQPGTRYQVFGKLKTLVTLDISRSLACNVGPSGWDLRDDDLLTLREGQIESINVSGYGSITDTGISALASIPTLRHLEFRSCPRISSQFASDLKAKLAGRVTVVFE